MANVSSLVIPGIPYDNFKVLQSLIQMGLQLIDVNRGNSNWPEGLTEARFKLDENTVLHIIITGKIEEGAHLEVATTKENYIKFAGQPATMTCVRASEFMHETGVEAITNRILDVLTD